MGRAPRAKFTGYKLWGLQIWEDPFQEPGTAQITDEYGWTLAKLEGEIPPVKDWLTIPMEWIDKIYDAELKCRLRAERPSRLIIPPTDQQKEPDNVKSRITISGRAETIEENVWHSGPDYDIGTFIFEGDLDVEVEEMVKYVSVAFLNEASSKYSEGRTYAYVDPTGGELKVGDIVEVPVGYSTQMKLARVKKLGKNGYDGAPIKAVAKILKAEAL